MDGIENRRYARLELSPGMPVAFRMADKSAVARATGLSLGGLFIATQEPAAPGTSMTLLVKAPVGDVRARAEVRRSVPGSGMGVEFVAMSMEDRARMVQCLKTLGL
jgi:hypothetical protein